MKFAPFSTRMADHTICVQSILGQPLPERVSQGGGAIAGNNP